MVKFRFKLKRVGRVAIVYGVSALMIGTLLGAGMAPDTQDFPTWEEIRAAQGNEAASAAKIAEVERLLQELRKQAAAVGDTAVEANWEHDAATEALEAGKRRLLLLQEKHANALSASAELKHRAGGIAAQAYKTGSTSAGVLLLLDADQAVEAANRLAMTNIVGGRTNALYDQAQASADVAEALERQQETVLTMVEDLSEEAAQTLEQAESADQRARQAVARQEDASARLLGQLAELKGTTAELEAERLHGLAAQEAYREQEEAAREAAKERNNGPGPADKPRDRPVATPPQPGLPDQPDPTVPEKPSKPAPPPTFPTVPSPPPPKPAPTPKPPAPAPVPEPAPQPPPQVIDSPAAAQAYASSRMSAFGWNNSEFRCLVNLWNRESGWQTSAQNPYSGAYGIPQSLPGSKMASAGADWRTNFRTQVDWGLGYISGRYGSPCSAWEHSENVGWY